MPFRDREKNPKPQFRNRQRPPASYEPAARALAHPALCPGRLPGGIAAGVQRLAPYVDALSPEHRQTQKERIPACRNPLSFSTAKSVLTEPDFALYLNIFACLRCGRQTGIDPRIKSGRCFTGKCSVVERLNLAFPREPEQRCGLSEPIPIGLLRQCGPGRKRAVLLVDELKVTVFGFDVHDDGFLLRLKSWHLTDHVPDPSQRR
jgi:hypothetical protein